MQRNPHSYQIATGYRTFYSLSLIYQPITKKRLFLNKNTYFIGLSQIWNLLWIPTRRKILEITQYTITRRRIIRHRMIKFLHILMAPNQYDLTNISSLFSIKLQKVTGN